MTAWQEAAQKKVEALLESHGEPARFASIPVKSEGEVYLETSFVSNRRALKLFVYKDEAGVEVDGRWHPFELPDWNNDPGSLLEALVGFVQAQIVTTAS